MLVLSGEVHAAENAAVRLSLTYREKENRSPAKRDTSDLRRGSKQTRVRFAGTRNNSSFAVTCTLSVGTVCKECHLQQTQNLEFLHVAAESENTPAASRTVAADTASTPPPVAQPSYEANSDIPLDAADLETPVGAHNLPTPLGTMGRAALPPTPFVPVSVTPGLNSAAAAQLSSWRSRAANAAFKAKSPPTSRSSAVKLVLCAHVSHHLPLSVLGHAAFP